MTGNRLVLIAAVALFVVVLTSVQFASYVLWAAFALAVVVQLVRAAWWLWRMWAVARFSLAAVLIDRAGRHLPPDASDVTIHFARWLGVDDLHMKEDL